MNTPMILNSVSDVSDATKSLNEYRDYDFKREVDLIYPHFLNELVVAGGSIALKYGHQDSNFTNIVDHQYDILIPHITPSAKKATYLNIYIKPLSFV